MKIGNWKIYGWSILIISSLGLGIYYWYYQPPNFEYEDSEFLLGGIQVNEPDYEDWTTTLQKVGMNTVSVTVYCKQSEWFSNDVWYEKTIANEASVIAEIQTAKKNGLKVVLIPRVAVDHAYDSNKFIWHGMIFPKTEEATKDWFKRYRAFLKYWAKICEKEGVDVMAIGSEMRAMTRTLKVKNLPPLEKFHLSEAAQAVYIQNHLKYKEELKEEHLWVRGFGNYDNLEDYLQDEVAKKEAWAKTTTFHGSKRRIQKINERRALLLQEWENLIDTTRTIYSGQLTYAANFDNYHNIGFWNKLDLMGINAYFQLRSPNATATKAEKLAAASASWKAIFKEIERFKWKQDLGNKKMLFTELGYIYKENCMVAPWQGFGYSIVHHGINTELYLWKDQKEDLEERTLAVKGLLEAHKSYQGRFLTGILYWKLTTKDYHIPYEPFVLHIQEEAKDPLQKALVDFVD